MARHIAKHEFDMYVLDSSKQIVLVDFWAPWCGPCKAMEPTLDQMENVRFPGKLEVIKINIDDEPELAQSMGVRSIPTMMLFSGHHKMDTIIGAVTPFTLINKITDALEKKI